MFKINSKTTQKINASLVLKAKIVMIAPLSVLALFVILLIAPLTFDNSALKSKIENKFGQSFNFTINGKVRVTLLPSPSLIAQDVIVQSYTDGEKTYNIYAKKVQVKTSFSSIFGGKFNPTKIILSDLILERFYNLNQPANKSSDFASVTAEVIKNKKPTENAASSSISSSLFSVDEVNFNDVKPTNLPDVVIENGKAFLYDNNAKEKQISKIDIIAKFDKQRIGIEGSFYNDNIVNNIELSAKFNSSSKKPDSRLKITSGAMHLEVNGVFSSENKGILFSDFTGKAAIEIFDLKSFYKNYIDSGLISQKLKSPSKSIKLSANIVNTGGEIVIDNINIDSDLIKGGGNIVIDFTAKIPTADLNLSLDNLDLDNIWSKERVVQAANSNASTDQQNKSGDDNEEIKTTNNQQQQQNISDQTKILQPLLSQVPQNKDFDISAEIKIKNATYLAGEMKDVSLYFTTYKQGKIIISPLIFNIPGQGIMRASGILDNGLVPKFTGKFDVSGKNLGEVFKWLKIDSQNLKYDSLKEYSIYSDIELMPNNVKMDNFYLNLDNNQSEFLGNISIDNNDKTPVIVNKFRISSFNANDYFLVSGQNAYLSSGSLLKKIFWLNNISSNNDLTLFFDKLVYNGEEFHDQTLKLQYRQGYIEINNLVLKSEKTDLIASLIIDISKADPRFDLSISANKFNYTSPIYESPKSDKADDKNSENKTPEKETTQKLKINIIDQFYALPSLEGFSGKINLAFIDANFDDTNIKSAKLVGDLKDGIINISEMKCGLYGGDLDYKGTIGIKNNKIINGNITYNNANLGQLLPNVFSINSIDGIANISANISSSTNAKNSFKNTLSSEIKFSSSAPIVYKYGLMDLIKKMFAAQKNIDELQNPEKILFNSDSATTLKQASGTIAFKDSAEGKFKINIVAPVTNGIVSGRINILTNKIDGLANIIFLTGNREKQVPINIATSFKGDTSSPSQSSNFNQIKQYLGISKTILLPSASNNAVNSNAAPAKESQLEAQSQGTNQPQIPSSIESDAIAEIKKSMADPQGYSVSPEFRKKQQALVKSIEDQTKQLQQNQNNDQAKSNK